jgi:NTE family protein
MDKVSAYQNLVLAGGGIKIIASIGALEIVQELGVLQQITGFAGSSAGAIVAGALSVGYTVAELKKILLAKNFNDFKDAGWMAPIQILYHYGWCRGDALYQWLGDMIQTKTGNPDISFKQVYQQYGKYLIITGCCLNKRETHYYSHRSNPDMPIRQAVRISMSIPGLFVPIQWGGDVLVDGGLLENYCIYIFDKKDPNSKTQAINEQSPPHVPQKTTLGIKLLSSNELPDGQIYHGDVKITNFVGYLESIINTMMTQIDRSIISQHYWDRTIPINTGDIPIGEFNLSKEKKLELIELGRNTAIKFFEGLNV